MLNFNVSKALFLLPLMFTNYLWAQQADTTKNHSISYKIQPVFENDEIKISVECLFFTGDTTSTEFGFFPQLHWNQHDYLLQDIQPLSPNIKVKKSEQNLRWYIEHLPKSLVRLKYLLYQDSAAFVKQDLRNPFPLILGQNYFFAENASLFLVPAEWLRNNDEYNLRRKIRLEWLADSTWRYANSFGMHKQKQNLHISAKNFIRNLTVGSRNQSRCSLSVWQLNKRQEISVATMGVFGEKNPTFAKAVHQTAESCVRFFQDTLSFCFLAAIMPVGLPEHDENGVLGFALNDAFVGMISDKKDSLHFLGKYLLTHEMIHKWVNAERFPLHDYTGFGYCAAEGFTDYLARYIMLKNGIISQQEYVEDMNSNIRSYIQSSQINATADSIRKNFWHNLHVMKIPYRRGDLLAHLWSNEIRKHTGGKHDFATALRDIIQQHSGVVIIDQIFAAALEPYIGRNVIDDILRYMKNGETIPIPEDLIPFARLSPHQDSTGVSRFELMPEMK